MQTRYFLLMEETKDQIQGILNSHPESGMKLIEAVNAIEPFLHSLNQKRRFEYISAKKKQEVFDFDALAHLIQASQEPSEDLQLAQGQRRSKVSVDEKKEAAPQPIDPTLRAIFRDDCGVSQEVVTEFLLQVYKLIMDASSNILDKVRSSMFQKLHDRYKAMNSPLEMAKAIMKEQSVLQAAEALKFCQAQLTTSDNRDVNEELVIAINKLFRKENQDQLFQLSADYAQVIFNLHKKAAKSIGCDDAMVLARLLSMIDDDNIPVEFTRIRKVASLKPLEIRSALRICNKLQLTTNKADIIASNFGEYFNHHIVQEMITIDDPLLKNAKDFLRVLTGVSTKFSRFQIVRDWIRHPDLKRIIFATSKASQKQDTDTISLDSFQAAIVRIQEKYKDTQFDCSKSNLFS